MRTIIARVIAVALWLGLFGGNLAETSAAPNLTNFFQAWRAPTEPAHIVGPIYFVGTRGLSVFLIKTDTGHILLDGAMPASEELIEASIRKLGFKVEDVRQLLISQAHFDHVGTLAYFKKKTGASLAVMTGDDEVLKTGGRADYLFGPTAPYHFAPVTADRILKDGDVVALGGVSLTARHTPGHTPGCTTWAMKVEENGKAYEVVFAGSTTVNTGTQLVGKPSYPGIAEDYQRALNLLESLRPDIFLGAHPEFFNFEGKRRRAATEGPKAYVDPEGYRARIAAQRKSFEATLSEQKTQ